jgi:hypothetical protein
MRRTLADAEAAGVLGSATRAALEGLARDCYYPDRSYPRVLQRAAERELPPAELAALRAWLPNGRADQKREDALAMLRLMRERLAAGLPPKRVDYQVEYTDVWDEARRRAGALESDEQGAETLFPERLLDELRLEREAYGHAFQGTLARLLAIDETRRQGVVVSPELLADIAETFRREHGLLQPAGLARWQTDNHLTAAQLARLLDDEARLRWVETLAHSAVVGLLPDYLRASGQYPRLAARARDKQRRLERAGLASPAAEDTGLSEDALLRWYFVERLGYPAALDPGAYAAAVGFPDPDAFRRALRREYCYVRQTALAQSGAEVSHDAP